MKKLVSLGAVACLALLGALALGEANNPPPFKTLNCVRSGITVGLTFTHWYSPNDPSYKINIDPLYDLTLDYDNGKGNVSHFLLGKDLVCMASAVDKKVVLCYAGDASISSVIGVNSYNGTEYQLNLTSPQLAQVQSAGIKRFGLDYEGTNRAQFSVPYLGKHPIQDPSFDGYCDEQ